MTSPTNLYPIQYQVVISVEATYPSGREISDLLIGTVQQVGEDVNKVIIGQQVVFKNDYYFIEGINTWALTHQKNIFLIYTPPIP